MDERLLNVNQHGVLRVPAELWLALCLLCRLWLLVLFALLSSRGGGYSMAVLAGGIPWVGMACQLPALSVLAAGLARVPSAPVWTAWLWRQGRVMMTLTIALNLVLSGSGLLESDAWEVRSRLVLSSLSILDVAVAWAIWTSPYLRQVYAEFPRAKRQQEEGRSS